MIRSDFRSRDLDEIERIVVVVVVVVRAINKQKSDFERVNFQKGEQKNIVEILQFNY